MVPLELHAESLFLLYFRRFTIVLTASPNVETRLFYRILAAYSRVDLARGAFRHRSRVRGNEVRLRQAEGEY